MARADDLEGVEAAEVGDVWAAFFDRGNAFTLKKLQELFAPKMSNK